MKNQKHNQYFLFQSQKHRFHISAIKRGFADFSTFLTLTKQYKHFSVFSVISFLQFLQNIITILDFYFDELF